MTTKHGCVSPPGELDETSDDWTRSLATRRRTFSELQMPVLDAAAATEDGDETKATENSVVAKKVRYFSNFYRQPEPGEVFVGGRSKTKTDHEVSSGQSAKHVDWMTNSRLHLLPPNSPFPQSFTNKPHSSTAVVDQGHSLFHPSLAAIWAGYQLDYGTVTSFPPLLGHVTSYDVAELSLCRRS